MVSSVFAFFATLRVVDNVDCFLSARDGHLEMVKYFVGKCRVNVDATSIVATVLSPVVAVQTTSEITSVARARYWRGSGGGDVGAIGVWYGSVPLAIVVYSALRLAAAIGI